MTNTHETTPVIPLPETGARLATTVGAIATLASTFLAWTWTDEFPGDLTVTGYPGGLQVITLVGAALTLLFALAGHGVRGLGWLNPAGSNNALLLIALGTFGTTWYTVIAIAQELGGIANLEPGGFVAAAASLITLLAALGLPLHRDTDPASSGLKKALAAVFGIGGTKLPGPRHSPPGPKSSSSPPHSPSACSSPPTDSRPKANNSSAS